MAAGNLGHSAALLDFIREFALVHCLMGRWEAVGGSPAKATILATCSAVMRTGLLGCGASVRRSATGNSSSDTGCNTS